MQWNNDFNIASIILTSAIMVHYYFKKNIATKQTLAFWRMLLFSLLYSSFDILSTKLYGFTGTAITIINYIINDAIMLLTTLLVSSFNFFFVPIVSEKKKIHKHYYCSLFIPIILTCLLIIANFFTPCLFYFDSSGNYCLGYLHDILYLFTIFYLIDTIRIVHVYKPFFTIPQQLGLYFYITLSIATFIIQYVLVNVLVVAFSGSIDLIVLYLLIQNPENYENKQLSTFNKIAFSKVIYTKIDNEENITVLGLQLNGLKVFNDKFSLSNSELITKKVAEYLLKITPGHAVFSLSDSIFAIICKKDENIDEFTKTIFDRFEDTFIVKDIEVSLSVSICCLKYPDIISNVSEMITMIDYTFSNVKFSGKNETFFVNNDLIEEYKRDITIESIVNKAIKNESFEVYYQPIYSVKEDRFTSLEALIRLKDPELGFIRPDEFIPLAEKNGSIIRIGLIVFSKVCKFINECSPQNYGISYINVNLSVVQCMQEQLYDELFQYLNTYDISPNLINLEITESATYISNKILLTNMNKFIHKGISFSLDDYGTGFSNITNIIEFPLDFIKIDKSIVWAAMETDRGLKILRHTIHMIKSLNLKIIAEGIETIEHVNILTQMGCDYFQGFYYSKPVDHEKIMLFLAEKNKIKEN